MAKKQKSAKARLSDHLRSMLGQRATRELLGSVAPDMLADLKDGDPAPTIAELLARKVIRLALDADSPKQWAVELVFDRTEGKSIQGLRVQEDERVIEERLDDISIGHINRASHPYASPSDRDGLGGASDGADGPAARLMDLPSHRTRRTQEAQTEPPVEDGAPEAG